MSPSAMDPPRPCPSCGHPLPAGAHGELCPRCVLARALEEPAPPPAPAVEALRARLAERLPELEILAPLGHGGMGHVFRARQRALDRLVAVKVLRPELLDEPEAVERFTREARALARLHHPSIVAVHDFGRLGDTAYLVLEHVEGPSLRELLHAGRLDARRALDVVRRVCDALRYAHDRGVVHRDVKPENVLVDPAGRVKIADFGLAKLVTPAKPDVGLTPAGPVMGTLRHMAPERMDRPLEVDHRADVYSLGVVFYELLTGEVPAGRFQPPSARAGSDARLDDVVLRALEREPARRYQRAAEVRTDVDALETDAPAGSAPAPPHGAADAPHGERDVSPEAVLAATIAALAPPLAAAATLALMLAFVDFPLRGGDELEFLLCATPAWLGLAALGGAAWLGGRARRAILAARPRPRGLGAALFALWLVPLLVVDGLAIAAINVPLDVVGPVPAWLPPLEVLGLVAADAWVLTRLRAHDLALATDAPLRGRTAPRPSA